MSDNFETMSAEKFQLWTRIQVRELKDKVGALDAHDKAEGTSQRQVDTRLTKVEERLKFMTKLVYGLGSLLGTGLVSLLIWYLTQK